MEDRPGKRRIEAVTLGPLDPGEVLGNPGGLEVGLGDLDRLLHAVVGEDVILRAGNHDQLAGRGQAAQLGHVEGQGDVRHKVAVAVVHGTDRILVGANGTGGHRNADALVDGRGVAGRGTAARVAHAGDGVGIHHIEILGDNIDHAADVEHALTDGGSAVEQTGERGNDTAGALLGAAAGAEATLLDHERTEALAHDLAGKVTVAAVDDDIVAGIDRATHRDVAALGVALQADDGGQLALLALRRPQVAGNIIVLLTLEGEEGVGVGIAVGYLLNGEAIVGGRGDAVDPKQGTKMGARLLLPIGKGLLPVITHTGGQGTERIVMNFLRIVIHDSFSFFL